MGSSEFLDCARIGFGDKQASFEAALALRSVEYGGPPFVSTSESIQQGE